MSGFSGGIKLTGRVRLVLRDQNEVIKEVRVTNLVTTAGLQGTIDNLLASPTLGKPTHIAVGEGTPAANALGVEIERLAMSSKTRSGAVLEMSVFYDAGSATGAITESGVFNQATGGNMWLSTSFDVINKGSLDTLTIDWTLTASTV